MIHKLLLIDIVNYKISDILNIYNYSDNIMLRQKEMIEKIAERLALLSLSVSNNNSINHTDINISAEAFYCGLLNILLNGFFVNANDSHQNADAIDLIDTENRMAVQITSTASFAKIKKTVDGFNKKNMHEKIDRLIILNITKKSKHKKSTYGDEDKFVLDLKKDVWDSSDLMRLINSKNINDIETICKYFDKHFNTHHNESIPKEIVTILSLIEILSSDDHPSANNGFLEKPDPENKIYVRFFEYSNELTSRYFELSLMYNGILRSIEKQSDAGTLAMNKLAAYLRSYSHRTLANFDNNPVVALENMINYYCIELSKKGVDYDYTAVEFYLLHSLVNCNVFPNIKDNSHANPIL